MSSRPTTQQSGHFLLLPASPWENSTCGHSVSRGPSVSIPETRPRSTCFTQCWKLTSFSISSILILGFLTRFKRWEEQGWGQFRCRSSSLMKGKVHVQPPEKKAAPDYEGAAGTGSHRGSHCYSLYLGVPVKSHEITDWTSGR